MPNRFYLLVLFGFNLVAILFAGCGEDISYTLNFEGYISNTGDRITPAAHIQNVWTEHNVFHEGRKGMRIHIQFDIDAQKGNECSLNAYFYSGDDNPLYDFNGLYATSQGNVVLGEFFTPTYESAFYRNFAVFMPYDELHMADGEYNLKYRLVVWGRDENNKWIELALSEWFYFVYTQSTSTNRIGNRLYATP
jgi:hypothetical protein